MSSGDTSASALKPFAESVLTPYFNALKLNDYKKALETVQDCLKKYGDHSTLLGYQLYVLYKSTSNSELFNETISRLSSIAPVDDRTLHLINISTKASTKPHVFRDILELSVKKQAKNPDFVVQTIIQHIRFFGYSRAAALSLQLYMSTKRSVYLACSAVCSLADHPLPVPSKQLQMVEAMFTRLYPITSPDGLPTNIIPIKEFMIYIHVILAQGITKENIIKIRSILESNNSIEFKNNTPHEYTLLNLHISLYDNNFKMSLKLLSDIQHTMPDQWDIIALDTYININNIFYNNNTSNKLDSHPYALSPLITTGQTYSSILSFPSQYDDSNPLPYNDTSSYESYILTSLDTFKQRMIDLFIEANTYKKPDNTTFTTTQSSQGTKNTPKVNKNSPAASFTGVGQSVKPGKYIARAPLLALLEADRLAINILTLDISLLPYNVSNNFIQTIRIHSLLDYLTYYTICSDKPCFYQDVTYFIQSYQLLPSTIDTLSDDMLISTLSTIIKQSNELLPSYINNIYTTISKLSLSSPSLHLLDISLLSSIMNILQDNTIQEYIISYIKSLSINTMTIEYTLITIITRLLFSMVYCKHSNLIQSLYNDISSKTLWYELVQLTTPLKQWYIPIATIFNLQLSSSSALYSYIHSLALSHNGSSRIMALDTTIKQSVPFEECVSYGQYNIIIELIQQLVNYPSPLTKAYATQIQNYKKTMNHLELPPPQTPPEDDSSCILGHFTFYILLNVIKLHNIYNINNKSLRVLLINILLYLTKKYSNDIQSQTLLCTLYNSSPYYANNRQLFKYIQDLSIKGVQTETLSHLYIIQSSYITYIPSLSSLYNEILLSFHNDQLSDIVDNYKRCIDNMSYDSILSLSLLSQQLILSQSYIMSYIETTINNTLYINNWNIGEFQYHLDVYDKPKTKPKPLPKGGKKPATTPSTTNASSTQNEDTSYKTYTNTLNKINTDITPKNHLIDVSSSSSSNKTSNQNSYELICKNINTNILLCLDTFYSTIETNSRVFTLFESYNANNASTSTTSSVVLPSETITLYESMVSLLHVQPYNPDHTILSTWNDNDSIKANWSSWFHPLDIETTPFSTDIIPYSTSNKPKRNNITSIRLSNEYYFTPSTIQLIRDIRLDWIFILYNITNIASNNTPECDNTSITPENNISTSNKLNIMTQDIYNKSILPRFSSNIKMFINNLSTLLLSTILNDKISNGELTSLFHAITSLIIDLCSNNKDIIISSISGISSLILLIKKTLLSLSTYDVSIISYPTEIILSLLLSYILPLIFISNNYINSSIKLDIINSYNELISYLKLNKNDVIKTSSNMDTLPCELDNIKDVKQLINPITSIDNNIYDEYVYYIDMFISHSEPFMQIFQ